MQRAHQRGSDDHCHGGILYVKAFLGVPCVLKFLQNLIKHTPLGLYRLKYASPFSIR